MEGKRYHYINLIIASILVINLVISCSTKNKMDKLLGDVSSNAYYICFSARHGNQKQEVVIPNSNLYYILQSEKGEKYNITTYIDIMTPVVLGEQELELSQNLFDEIRPYILPANWATKNIKGLDYFKNGVQNLEIEHELEIIKQLNLQGYLIYKDDETGLLVLSPDSPRCLESSDFKL